MEPEDEPPSLADRLRGAVETGDTDALRSVIEEAGETDEPRNHWEREPVGRRPNLQLWLYRTLRGHVLTGDPEGRSAIIRTLYDYGLSTRQLALAFSIGKGSVHEVTKDMQQGVTIGLDGIERKRGVRSGGRPRRALTGKSFGRLTVMGEAVERAGNGRRYWRCKCDCGEEVEVRQDNLTTGRTTGCGCQQGKWPEGTTRRKRLPKKARDAIRVWQETGDDTLVREWQEAWKLYQTGRGPRP